MNDERNRNQPADTSGSTERTGGYQYEVRRHDESQNRTTSANTKTLNQKDMSTEDVDNQNVLKIAVSRTLSFTIISRQAALHAARKTITSITSTIAKVSIGEACKNISALFAANQEPVLLHCLTGKATNPVRCKTCSQGVLYPDLESIYCMP